MQPPIDVIAAARSIADAGASGREIVTVTLVSGDGAGARLISLQAGDLVDQNARAAADQVWAERRPLLAGAWFAELHSIAEPLLIFGAGHIAIPLADIAHRLGFAVTVLDDREEFARSDRFAEGVHVRSLDYEHPLAGIDITGNTFVVMVTRAHKYDFDCLKCVLELPTLPRYIGMIGSKRRVRAAFTALLDGGISRELLARVHAPVGVEIGAETPAEIAVSIAAELIQERRQARHTTMGEAARVLERMLPEQAAQ